MIFKIGKVVITRNARDTLDSISVVAAIALHKNGDWGDMCKEDVRSNEYALKHGERLFSSYKDVNDIKFWIITEADRSVTAVLLPDDY